MNEFIVNLHMHTVYSDGSTTHAMLGKIAARAGVDAIIVTDHNVLVNGVENYQTEGSKRSLVLVGQEINDPARDPQKNHLLVFGANRDLALFAPNPQQLIDLVKQSGGICFIAHPFDYALPSFGEGDISWVDWDVQGFTGIELWNGFSEIKTVIHSMLSGVFYAFFPKFIAHSPLSETLKLWDSLLGKGRKVVAVGGSDAHAMQRNLGPIHRTILPYDYHFRSINNHILSDSELSGSLADDRKLIYDALKAGHSFIGYDLPASTRSFRFSGRGKSGTAIMGDEIPLEDGITFQIHVPGLAECRLLRDGEVINTWNDTDICTFIANQAGVYRVECYTHYLGKRRGWIFSNPIYVTSSTGKS